MNWMDLAECKDDGRNWFPDETRAPKATRELLEVCSRCPVTDECLEYAVEFERNMIKLIGVFGGRTALERYRARREAA